MSSDELSPTVRSRRPVETTVACLPCDVRHDWSTTVNNVNGARAQVLGRSRSAEVRALVTVCGSIGRSISPRSVATSFTKIRGYIVRCTGGSLFSRCTPYRYCSRARWPKVPGTAYGIYFRVLESRYLRTGSHSATIIPTYVFVSRSSRARSTGVKSGR